MQGKKVGGASLDPRLGHRVGQHTAGALTDSTPRMYCRLAKEKLKLLILSQLLKCSIYVTMHTHLHHHHPAKDTAKNTCMMLDTKVEQAFLTDCISGPLSFSLYACSLLNLPISAA